MLFQMNSKWFRYGSYDIIDQKGDVAYRVEGKLWSLGDNLKILKPDGAEVGSIRTSFLFNPFEKYQIQLNKKVQAKFNRDSRWYRPFERLRYKLDIPGSEDYSIVGNFWENEFEFLRKERKVATVSRKFFSLTDSYGIEIEKGEDDVAILAAAVVLNTCRRKRHNGTY